MLGGHIITRQKLHGEVPSSLYSSVMGIQYFRGDWIWFHGNALWLSAKPQTQWTWAVSGCFEVLSVVCLHVITCQNPIDPGSCRDLFTWILEFCQSCYVFVHPYSSILIFIFGWYSSYDNVSLRQIDKCFNFPKFSQQVFWSLTWRCL